jgi:hypothetical protein
MLEAQGQITNLLTPKLLLAAAPAGDLGTTADRGPGTEVPAVACVVVVMASAAGTGTLLVIDIVAVVIYDVVNDLSDS